MGWEAAYLDQTRVGDDRLELDGVDQRLAESDFLDAGVVKTVDVVPD